METEPRFHFRFCFPRSSAADELRSEGSTTRLGAFQTHAGRHRASRVLRAPVTGERGLPAPRHQGSRGTPVPGWAASRSFSHGPPLSPLSALAVHPPRKRLRKHCHCKHTCPHPFSVLEIRKRGSRWFAGSRSVSAVPGNPTGRPPKREPWRVHLGLSRLTERYPLETHITTDTPGQASWPVDTSVCTPGLRHACWGS